MPGGPDQEHATRDPAPRLLNFSGYLRNSTTSWSSVLASSTPATSLNVTTVLLPRNIRARLLPNDRAWLFVPWACLIMNRMKPPMRMSGNRPVRINPSHDVSGAGLPSNVGSGLTAGGRGDLTSPKTSVRMLGTIDV